MLLLDLFMQNYIYSTIEVEETLIPLTPPNIPA